MSFEHLVQEQHQFDSLDLTLSKLPKISILVLVSKRKAITNAKHCGILGALPQDSSIPLSH